VKAARFFQCAHSKGSTVRRQPDPREPARRLADPRQPGGRLPGKDQSGGCHLEGANLEGANLRNANLVDAHLAGANVAGAYLENTDLSWAFISQTQLENACGTLKTLSVIETEPLPAQARPGTLILKPCPIN